MNTATYISLAGLNQRSLFVSEFPRTTHRWCWSSVIDGGASHDDNKHEAGTGAEAEIYSGEEVGCLQRVLSLLKLS